MEIDKIIGSLFQVLIEGTIRGLFNCWRTDLFRTYVPQHKLSAPQKWNKVEKQLLCCWYGNDEKKCGAFMYEVLCEQLIYYQLNFFLFNFFNLIVIELLNTIFFIKASWNILFKYAKKISHFLFSVFLVADRQERISAKTSLLKCFF